MITTLGQVLNWLETPMKLSIENNRDDMVDTANRVRELFYNLYTEIPLFIDYEMVFEVQCFRDVKGNFYDGFSLPRDAKTLEAAWVCGEPIPLYGKWREWKDGIKKKSDCSVGIFEQAGEFPTERDMLCPGRILVLASSGCDIGKEVTIRGQKVPLSTDYRAVNNFFEALKPGDIRLPSNLKGGVTVAEEKDCRVLSEYAPGETVPSYKRVKVTGVCKGDQVVARVNRRFVPVWYDDDLVETNNRLAWENAALYLRNSDQGVDPAMIQKAQYHYQTMLLHLKGDKSRELGMGSSDNFNLMGLKTKGSVLPSRRRSFRWHVRLRGV